MAHKNSAQDETEERVRSIDKTLRKILDNMLEGVQIIGFDWKYIYVNDAMAKHGKYPKEEFAGTTVMEKYPGIEHTEVYKVYQRCFNERVPIQMENQFIFPDGSVGWFELSFRPVPEGIFILSIDITQRKKNEERVMQLNENLENEIRKRTALLEYKMQQLKESEEKFQKAFQASGAAISITRLSDSVYVDVNDAFIELTGSSIEELIGHTSLEAGFIIDFDQRAQALKHVREQGSLKNFELTIHNKKGQKVTILSSIETVILNGEPHAINIIYDITQRKKAEEQLGAVNKELEAFAYTASHDLKSPLRAVNGYTEMLALRYKNLFDDEGKRLLGVIQNKALKMSQLIDDLLAFSKLGNTPVKKEDINMDALMENALGEISRTIKHNAEIITGPLKPLRGDHVLIKQVMINLVSNGIKYSSKKEHPVVEITSTETDNDVTYTVKDNGEGFDMKYAGKLFGVFERLHSSEEFEGTGVGLAIVKRIITNHGGKVWAEGKEGEGATFIFTLPK